MTSQLSGQVLLLDPVLGPVWYVCLKMMLFVYLSCVWMYMPRELHS